MSAHTTEQTETLTVTAQFRTDDYEYEFVFDATAALAEFSDERLLALREIGYTGDYESDEVAYQSEDRVPEIAAALAYCEEHSRDRNPVGFNVEVDPEQAEAWIAAHRPHLAR